MPHAYATTAQLRRALGNPSTTDAPEADLLRALEAAAEAVDAYTGRTFQPYSGVVYPDLAGVHGRGRLYAPDFLTLTEVAQDDGTGAYATAWAASDYLAYPYDAPSRQRPYVALERAYAGRYYWPYYPNWLRLTGLFGYWQKLVATAVTVLEAVDTVETDIDVTNQTPLMAGLTIRVDAEQMYVTEMDDAGPTTVVTVERGVNGTTAATHLTAAPISVYVYPAPVEAAALAYAQAVRGGGALATAASGVARRRAGDLEIEYGTRMTGATGHASFDFSPWLLPYRRRSLFS